MKSSGAARVFSTPVRFGPTTHQTRPARDERHGAADGDHGSGSLANRTNHHAVRTDEQSRGGDLMSQRTTDNLSTSTVGERKSVFERLFERAHRQRHSKPATNGQTASKR